MKNLENNNLVETLEEKKQKEVVRLCEGAPDSIYILSGISEVVDPVSDAKTYKPGSYATTDWKGFMSGGKARALAAVELAQRFPQAVVAANSNTFNVLDATAPTDADVMAEYLEKNNVPKESIIKQDRSTTTFTELIELVKYIADKKWKHPVVVAGETQRPRTMEMLKQIETLQDPDGASQDSVFREALEYLKTENPKITIISAEDILPIRNRLYSKVIAEAKETDLWKEREQLDQQALDQLQEGLYWKNK